MRKKTWQNKWSWDIEEMEEKEENLVIWKLREFQIWQCEWSSVLDTGKSSRMWIMKNIYVSTRGNCISGHNEKKLYFTWGAQGLR